MKLVEKKCPNCGGGLSFGPEDKETKCEYCGKSFVIEREDQGSAKSEDLFNADLYKISEEAQNAIVGSMAMFKIVPIIIGVVFFMVFVGIGFTIFKFDHKESSITTREKIEPKEEEIEEKTYLEKLEEAGYVTDFSQISEDMLNSIQESTSKKITNDVNRHGSIICNMVGSPEHIGMYLGLSNKGTGNYLTDVFKVTFVVNGSNKDYYVSVTYPSVKLKDGKVVMNLDVNAFFKTVSVNDKVTHSEVVGEDSAKSLYNKEILKTLEEYEIKTLGDVYHE